MEWKRFKLSTFGSLASAKEKSRQRVKRRANRRQGGDRIYSSIRLEVEHEASRTEQGEGGCSSAAPKEWAQIGRTWAACCAFRAHQPLFCETARGANSANLANLNAN